MFELCGAFNLTVVLTDCDLELDGARHEVAEAHAPLAVTEADRQGVQDVVSHRQACNAE